MEVSQPLPRPIRPVLLLALVLAGVSATGRVARAAAPRLVILYATCTVNKSFLAPYAPGVPYTPKLAAFAERALVFTRHQTVSPQSGVAFASLFSGRDSDGTGVFSAPVKMPAGVTLVTDVFRDAGFDVYAWLGHPMASIDLGYAGGTPPDHRWSTMLTAAEPAFQGILSRLRSDPAYRAFVVTNFTVTHGPYRGVGRDRLCARFPAQCPVPVAPAAFARLHALFRANYVPLAFDFAGTRARLELSGAELAQLVAVAETSYKADVAHLDGLFGDVVDAVAQAGLDADSVIVFTADHGEVLYRPNAAYQWSHSLQLAPEALGVPLLVSAPAAGLAPRRVEFVTRAIDVLPTLATLAGIAPPKGTAGTDLVPSLRRGDDPGLTAFSHTAVLPEPVRVASRAWPALHRAMPGVDPEYMWVSLRRQDLVVKLQSRDGVHFVPQVYDLAHDPIELRDRYDPGDASQTPLVERLRAYKQGLVAAYRARLSPGAGVATDEQERRLRSLGYIE